MLANQSGLYLLLAMVRGPNSDLKISHVNQLQMAKQSGLLFVLYLDR